MSQQLAAEGIDRAGIRLQIYRGARLDSNYLVMNALATIVAAYGLLSDSTAVVIGAMLLAMLLGPILGLALGLVDGNTRLLVRSAVAEVAGAGLVLAVGFAIGLMNRDLPITREILVRTEPNLLDLGIALAGGAAAAYAICVPKVSAGMVGVAIATALAPPLTACGICLSRGMLAEAAGAFLLFFTNLVAIQFASSLVLAAFGLHAFSKERSREPGFQRRIAVDAALLAALVVFLSDRLGHSISVRRAEDTARRTLESVAARIPGARVIEVNLTEREDQRNLVAVVRTPRAFRPPEVAQAESALRSALGGEVTLRVRSVLTEEATSQGVLSAQPYASDPSSTEDWR